MAGSQIERTCDLECEETPHVGTNSGEVASPLPLYFSCPHLSRAESLTCPAPSEHTDLDLQGRAKKRQTG